MDNMKKKVGEADIASGGLPYNGSCISDFVAILIENNYEVHIKKCDGKFHVEYYEEVRINPNDCGSIGGWIIGEEKL